MRSASSQLKLLFAGFFFLSGVNRIVCAQVRISPGAKAVLFAPGIISTAAGEFAPTFGPDRKTVYFTSGPNFIYFSKLDGKQWTKPVLASFSGKWKDMDPFMSPDGKEIFFSSYRPYKGTTQLKFAHIWYVERLSGESWSEPRRLDTAVNTEGVNNYAPAVSKNGTLYFYSPNRDPDKKSTYYCRWIEGHYTKPRLVPIGGNGGVHDPYISPDERFLIFASEGQLYISFNRNGIWTDRQILPAQVNDGGKNSSPSLSPDTKTLYYSSSHADGILMIAIELKSN